MTKIKKRKEVRVIEDPDDFDEDNPESRVLLCPHCIEFGFKELLRHKILMRGEKPAKDYNDWCQCVSRCGKIFQMYQVKVEGILTETIEVVSNPFDEDKNIVGLGNKEKKTRRQRERQELLDRIEEEKDPEIKTELMKGYTVNVIEI